MSFAESIEEIVAANQNGLLSCHGTWVRVRLGDIASVLNGFAFPSSNFVKIKGIPLIRIRDIGNDNTQSNYEGDFDARYLIQPGELLVGMDGDFNSSIWKGPAGLLNQRVCKIKTSEEFVASRFVSYTISGYLNAINADTSSVTVKHLSSKTIEDIPLPLPPLSEQHRIASEIETQFTRLDACVAALKRARVNLKRYRASVLKSACEGRLVPTEAELARHEGKGYEPASVLLERILEERRARWEAQEKRRGQYKEPSAPDTSNLPELTEGWAWATWDQLSPRVTVGHVGPMKDEYKQNGIPFLRSQNVRENYFDSKGLLFIDDEFHNKLSKSTLRPGDIVRSGVNFGVTCVIPVTLTEANCSDLVIIKSPEALDHHYGSYYMNSVAKGFIQAAHVGVAIPHFNTKSVSAMPIAVPPIAEQHRIVAEVERRLSVIQSAEASVEANLKRAERMRQSILKQAFAGKLVPQDPADEPASALLERIRLSKTRGPEPSQNGRREADMGADNSAGLHRRRPLLEVLEAFPSGMTPEQLLAESGHSADSIDSYYAELKEEVVDGRIEEVRSQNEGVILRRVPR